jgi:hypothetical protein
MLGSISVDGTNLEPPKQNPKKNTALGSDGQGQTSLSPVFLISLIFLIFLFFSFGAWLHHQPGLVFRGIHYATASASYGS